VLYEGYFAPALREAGQAIIKEIMDSLSTIGFVQT
jgi:hypothetical protein